MDAHRRGCRRRERERKCGNRKGIRRNEGVRIMFFSPRCLFLTNEQKVVCGGKNQVNIKSKCSRIVKK